MKKKILIVTKFYYRRGGDCVCALNLERLLKDKGHETAVFAMNYPENDSSQWQVYWPAEVSFSGGMKSKLHAVARTFGAGDVGTAFNKLLDDFHPDVVHLHNIHSYLSPKVAQIAHERGIRTVWTMHDYKLLCPSYSCLRDGAICELCFEHKRNVLTKRCMKGSLSASVIAYLEAKRWTVKRLQRYTDAFICPSGFMAKKMKQGGYDDSKLNVLTNYISSGEIEAYRSLTLPASGGEYYCYVGRLSEEKGLRTLLDAASTLPYKLKVAGDGPLGDDLQQHYGEKGNIEFLGRIDAAGVRELLCRSRFSVIPSECYENNPLSVIESLCVGIPVVGADIGGIPELITSGRGLTFASGDKDSLVRAIEKAWEMNLDRESLRKEALTEFSPEVHYEKLMRIYG